MSRGRPSCAPRSTSSARPGTDARAARIWTLAGIVGAALGPAVGGILTQLLGWESIFFVQAPVVLLALVALRGVRAVPVREPVERPHVGANAALLLISGGLVAALFLLVILLINGWRLDPLQAGLAVTVMPLAAIAAARFGQAITPLWARATSGVILIAGGLAALGWLPHAGVAWTFPPQLAVGVGLGLALSALTERALAGRSAQAVHGGWTIAARHAGVVLGLLLLTPIFTTDLHKSERDVLASGTAAILDSRIPPLDKITVARHIRARGRRREAAGAHPRRVRGGRRARGLGLRRTSSRACKTSSTAPSRRRSRALPRRRAPLPARPRADPAPPTGGERLMRAIVVAAAASLALIVVYLALGGASYAPARVADPCAPRDWRNPQGLQQTAEQIVLSALDGAACKLHVSREDMVLAFSSRASLARFAREHGVSKQELESLARAGLMRSIDDAERANQIDPRLADLLRGLAARVPI